MKVWSPQTSTVVDELQCLPVWDDTSVCILLKVPRKDSNLNLRWVDRSGVLRTLGLYYAKNFLGNFIWATQAMSQMIIIGSYPILLFHSALHLPPNYSKVVIVLHSPNSQRSDRIGLTLIFTPFEVMAMWFTQFLTDEGTSGLLKAASIIELDKWWKAPSMSWTFFA